MSHMLKQLGGANPPEVNADVLERLRSYQWPGNVRQLRNCLERAVLLSNEGVITANELPPEVGVLNGAMPYAAPPPVAFAGAPAPDTTSAAGNTGSLRDLE